VTVGHTQYGWKPVRWLISGLSLWVASAVVVFAMHGAGIAVLMTWGDAAPAGSPEAAIMLDMSAETAAPNTEKTDVAVDEVNQQQAEKEPEPEKKPVEKEPEPEQKIEPPKQAEVELPPPPKPVVKPQQKKMAALNTRQLSADKEATHAVTQNPGMMGQLKASYGVLISAHLNRYKNVPRGLESGGVVNLSFTLNRQGQVLSSRISHGSGINELDHEALDMLRRAQPFPPPPADLAGVQFPFTVPVRYSVR
jgi:protein TonB